MSAPYIPSVTGDYDPQKAAVAFLHNLSDDQPWMAEGLCRAIGRPDDWFEDEATRHLAAQVCADCPVAAQCLAYAITNNIHDGVWGSEDMSRISNRKRANLKAEVAA